ncbi:sarcosine oxidase subunit gamma family protein [Corticibacterium sp. UT-5YL-CI-8]|nr:sarcosine oxidase subunit gamma family protein [Tianweitania sp. UT-5YL-CI-8]
MSEYRLIHRTALSDKQPVDAAGISLTALPEGHVIHVLAEQSADMSATLEGAAAQTHSVRYVAPGQWFIVGDEPLADDAMAALLTRLTPHAAGVDQSHGRVRILARGPMVECVLAKGSGADLALSAFAVGRSTTTLIGHIAAHLTRVEDNAFEIMVLRGFAESLWDDLMRMSAEFAE